MSAPSNVPRSSSGSGGFGGPVAVIVLAVGCLAMAPVLVAVVGIVAAIAIPNYLRFQCKAKQGEAKAALTQLWAAEQSFYAEYGFYTSDLNAIGFRPDPAPRYLYGFAEAGPDPFPEDVGAPDDYDPDRKDTSDPAALGGGYSNLNARDSNGSALIPQDLPADAIVNPSSFKAAAVGDIAPDGGAVDLDIWTIDESRRLTVFSNDCT